MGSFPHELSGYRSITDDAVRALFDDWGVTRITRRVSDSNMLDAACDGRFKGIYIQGEYRPVRPKHAAR